MLKSQPNDSHNKILTNNAALTFSTDKNKRDSGYYVKKCSDYKKQILNKRNTISIVLNLVKEHTKTENNSRQQSNIENILIKFNNYSLIDKKKITAAIQKVIDKLDLNQQDKNQLVKLQQLISNNSRTKDVTNILPILNRVNVILNTQITRNQDNVPAQNLLSISLIVLDVACASIDLSANASMAMAKSTMEYAQILQDLATFQKFLAWLSGEYKTQLAQQNKNNINKDSNHYVAIPHMKLTDSPNSNAGVYEISSILVD